VLLRSWAFPWIERRVESYHIVQFPVNRFWPPDPTRAACELPGTESTFGRLGARAGLANAGPRLAEDMAGMKKDPAVFCDSEGRLALKKVTSFHPLHETVIQGAVKHAGRPANLSKRVSCHTFHHDVDATHLNSVKSWADS